MPYTLAEPGYQPTIIPQPFVPGSYVISEPNAYFICDREDDRLPIRRLQKEGDDVLSANELLQIALGEADGFEKILADYGVDFLSTLRSVPQVVEALHIDHLKATRLLAILGLGRRVFKEPQAAYPVIRGISDVFSRFRSLGSSPREQLVIALVNSRYLLVHDEILAVGRNEILRIPAYQVFYPAVLRQIHSVILIHNHVTGDATPSAEDYEFTKRIQEVAQVMNVDLLDHVIIGKDACTSCLGN
jgi:DNA repair protein RadC